MQKLAVVYFPKIDVERINNFRKKYDSGWKIIPPHITLVSPISEISESSLIEYIASTVLDIESFSIHLTGLMKTPDSCLFLLVKEGNEKIVTLHDKLYSGTLASYMPTDFPFAPHITLGCFQTSDNICDDASYTKAYAKAQNVNFDITCSFDAVSIIKGDGLSPAQIIKTIKFHS